MNSVGESNVPGMATYNSYKLPLSVLGVDRKVIVDLAKLKVLASSCRWCDSDVCVTHSFLCYTLCQMQSRSSIYMASIHYNKDGDSNDLQLRASILFSGIHFSKVKRLMDLLNAPCIHEKIYYRYQ